MKVQNLVVTEKYTDKQGQEKKSYRNIGKVFTYDDGGQSVLFEAIPINWDGRASIYDIKPKEGQSYSQPQQNAQPQYQQQQNQQMGQQQAYQQPIAQPQQQGQAVGQQQIAIDEQVIPF